MNGARASSSGCDWVRPASFSSKNTFLARLYVAVAKNKQCVLTQTAAGKQQTNTCIIAIRLRTIGDVYLFWWLISRKTIKLLRNSKIFLLHPARIQRAPPQHALILDVMSNRDFLLWYTTDLLKGCRWIYLKYLRDKLWRGRFPG